MFPIKRKRVKYGDPVCVGNRWIMQFSDVATDKPILVAWPKDTVYSVAQQAWFDFYVMRFKPYPGNHIPDNVLKYATQAFVTTFKPVKKEINR